jgi:hypothetical protein
LQIYLVAPEAEEVRRSEVRVALSGHCAISHIQVEVSWIDESSRDKTNGLEIGGCLVDRAVKYNLL